MRWVLDQGPTIALWGARHSGQLDPITDVEGWLKAAEVTWSSCPRSLGAELIEHGRDFDDAKEQAARIYAVDKVWCEESEHPRASKHVFGRDLRAACPSISKMRLWEGGKCRTVYRGIGWCKGEDESEESHELPL